VIAVDHESIDRDAATRGLFSLAEQTCQDFEIILVHDGPASDEWWHWAGGLPFAVNVMVCETGRRHGNYGHWSRDLGMRFAHGDWFIHHNIDNQWRPWALELISETIDDQPEAGAVVFPITHHKMGVTLTGHPVQVNNIDAMQMVARHDIWHDMNYWHNHVHDSDGRLYEEIASRTNVYVITGEPFGDNY
jgi:hypothetical protein